MKGAFVLLAFLIPTLQADTAYEMATGGDLRGAETEYRSLVLARPDDARNHFNLGTVLLLDGRYDEARAPLETAVRLDSTIAGPASYNLGNTDLQPAFADTALPDRDDRLRRAIEAYKGALLADPEDTDAKWNLELARRLLERDEPPPSGGGGGGGGGGDGPPQPGSQDPAPAPAAGDGPQPNVAESPAERLLRAANERELQVQRDRLQKPQPPGPILP